MGGYGHESGRQDQNRNSSVVIGDGANLGAFSRLRVSNPVTLFDSTFVYNLQPLIWEASTANGGGVAHSAANAAASLTLNGTASGSSIIQTKQYHTYIPGKSQLVFLTGVFGTSAGNTKRCGYFDVNNGLFFEQTTAGVMRVVRRTNTSGSIVDNGVAQSSWNLDTLDGSGGTSNPSGITLNMTKAQIFIIDFQWLGVGRVRFGFDIDGKIIYVHEFLNANSLSTVYMRTGTLPVRWEVTGNVADTLLAICASVVSEGAADRQLGYNLSYVRSAGVTAGSGAQTLAFNLRPKATFNSITNRIFVDIEDFFVAVIGINPVLVEVYYGTTVGGAPSWADVDTTYSAMQVDTAGTPSGGVKVMAFVAAAGAAVKGTGSRTFAARYPISLDIAGTGYNNITVYVTGLGGTSACYPGANWKEVR